MGGQARRETAFFQYGRKKRLDKSMSVPVIQTWIPLSIRPKFPQFCPPWIVVLGAWNKVRMQTERLFIGLLWPSKPTAHLYFKKSLNSPKNESCIEYVCFVCSGEGRSGGMVTIPGGLDLTANNRDGTGETDGLLVKSTPSSKATTSGTSNLGGGGVGGGGNSSGNSNGGSRAHRSLHWLYLFC